MHDRLLMVFRRRAGLPGRDDAISIDQARWTENLNVPTVSVTKFEGSAQNMKHSITFHHASTLSPITAR
jgi:hypothetical protein